ncbi:MAG: outer membrane protein [Beijerinckiaceae bacterium]
MLRKFLLSGAAFAAFATGTYAADLPSRIAPPVFVPPPVFTWTGFYIGGTAGYSWNDLTVTNINYAPVVPGGGGLPGGGNGNLISAGIALGGTAGYNYQIREFVIGVEADGSWLSNRTSSYTAFDAHINASNQTFDSKMDALVAGRGRFGYAFDSALVFVTGGLAVGHVGNRYVANIARGVDPTWSDSDWRLGWTAGAGLEVKIDQNWSVKGEGLYYQLADHTVGAVNQTQLLYRFSDQGFIARIGLNYLFGIPPAAAPVIAKY